MDQQPDINHPAKAVLEQLMAGVDTLERALKDAQHRSQMYALETESLQRQCRELQGQVQKLERDYADLRIQKGGFGIRTLALVCMVGILGGLFMAWAYLKLRPQPPAEALFEEYRRTHLFPYELQISRGEYRQVVEQLEHDAAQPEYAVIRKELEFARKLLGAVPAKK